MPATVNPEAADVSAVIAVIPVVAILAVIFLLDTLAHSVASTSPRDARLHRGAEAVPISYPGSQQF